MSWFTKWRWLHYIETALYIVSAVFCMNLCWKVPTTSQKREDGFLGEITGSRTQFRMKSFNSMPAPFRVRLCPVQQIVPTMDSQPMVPWTPVQWNNFHWRCNMWARTRRLILISLDFTMLLTAVERHCSSESGMYFSGWTSQLNVSRDTVLTELVICRDGFRVFSRGWKNYVLSLCSSTVPTTHLT